MTGYQYWALLPLLALLPAGCSSCNDSALSNEEIIRATKQCTAAGLTVIHSSPQLCSDVISRVQCGPPKN